MQNKKQLFGIIIVLTLIAPQVVGQKTTKKQEATKPTNETRNTEAEQKKVKSIIDFLQFILNTLGSNDTPSQDKDIMITESYSKIFRDGKVQIEDDLDEERNVITNKDVIAYLKDVDFFFKDVKFNLEIENIAQSQLPNGDLFYKVSTRRTLKGTTSDGQSVSNTIPRFIEVNYNPKDQDLKIVSIYTHEFDERKALVEWWKSLSYEWQSIFKRELNTTDSLGYSEIKKATAITKLNLSNNQYIQTINPLAQLQSLTYLNLSGAAINDLTPIRNLTELTSLDLSSTDVSDLTPLRYSAKLTSLDISNTKVVDVSVIEKMQNLKILNASNTSITDISSIENLNTLMEVNLSHTSIDNIEPLTNNTDLQQLYLSSTKINNLEALKNTPHLQILKIDSTSIKSLTSLSTLNELKLLYANHTLISDLSPLENLSKLERIYCDHTQINQQQAKLFTDKKSQVLVIYDSKDLKQWWETLTPEWQTVLCQSAGINKSYVKSGKAPSKEELAKITSLDSVNLNKNQLIVSLTPLKNFHKLKKLVASGTHISDLSPLQGLQEIAMLDISDTDVEDINIAQQFKKLKILKAENSKIQNIEYLTMPSVEKFYVDKTYVHDLIAREFLQKNPTSLIIYKSDHLNTWWTSLDETWKSELQMALGPNSKVDGESLHKLIESKSLIIKGSSISDITPIKEFIQLQELRISNSSLIVFPVLENLQTLKTLQITNSPLQQIETIGKLFNLEEIDISNTPVDEIYPLWRLDKLKKLNCAGTQIKRLDAVEKLQQLDVLDCSNTNVRKLDPLSYIKLKSLTCYNTKVPTREIENFKASHPECNVVYYR